MANSFEIRTCQNPLCGLRYPLVEGNPFGERCPRCQGSTISVLNIDLHTETVPNIYPTDFHLEALLDNIRSAWNVGAIFRTADGLGVKKLHLCGITPTPDNNAVHKTSLGAEKSIPWAYASNALTLAKTLLSEGVHLWALEQDKRAVPFTSKWQSDGQRIVMIVGNEVTGVDPDLLDLCERIIYIPMFGIKRSLNVEVAFGVAVSGLQNASS